MAAQVNLVDRVPAPTSLYSAVRRGPPTMKRLDASDQDADPRAQLAELNLLTLSCSYSITDQCIKRASSSWSVAIRLNNYNAPLRFETDTQLGP